MDNLIDTKGEHETHCLTTNTTTHKNGGVQTPRIQGVPLTYVNFSLLSKKAMWEMLTSVIIVPLCGSILQAETCQILRWSPSVAI